MNFLKAVMLPFTVSLWLMLYFKDASWIGVVACIGGYLIADIVSDDSYVAKRNWDVMRKVKSNLYKVDKSHSLGYLIVDTLKWSICYALFANIIGLLLGVKPYSWIHFTILFATGYVLAILYVILFGKGSILLHPILSYNFQLVKDQHKQAFSRKVGHLLFTVIGIAGLLALFILYPRYVAMIWNAVVTTVSIGYQQFLKTWAKIVDYAKHEIMYRS